MDVGRAFNARPTFAYVREAGIMTSCQTMLRRRNRLAPGGLPDPAEVAELKVFVGRHEQSLEDTVDREHRQIDERAYVAGLVERWIDPSRILTYGISFRGKEVLVG